MPTRRRYTGSVARNIRIWIHEAFSRGYERVTLQPGCLIERLERCTSYSNMPRLDISRSQKHDGSEKLVNGATNEGREAS